MKSLDDFAGAKLDELAARDLRRSLSVTAPLGDVRVEHDGRALVSFCSNDYLGLAGDPALRAAAAEALDRYGPCAGASRLITGNHPLYSVLEHRLAEMKGTEDTCVFGSGYLANLGVTPTLAGPDDLIVLDALSHTSMHTGARLTRGRIETFAHNDAADCRRILEELRAGHGRCVILTEGVFSMDGDLAPLSALSTLAKEFDAWLLVDDAHGFGVLGGGGGSACAQAPLSAEIPLHIGTLSKAVGAYGGFLAASGSVCALLRTRARSFVYSTGLPPAVVAGAIAGLEVISATPERVAAPGQFARKFCEAAGLAAPDSHIVPIRLGTAAAALEASQALKNMGFLVTAIRPPTVPAGTARLRLTFSASHTLKDILSLAAAMTELGLVPGQTEKAARSGL